MSIAKKGGMEGGRQEGRNGGKKGLDPHQE